MDARQEIGPDNPRLREFAATAVACAGFALFLLSRSVVSEAAVSSLLTAWGATTGMLCGLRRGSLILLAAAICDGLMHPPPDVATMVGWAVRWGVTLILLIAVSRLLHRLQTESRRARLDSLTGLPNRQAFLERCTAEISRANRFQRPLTIMLLDGDAFKSVNDRHGHAHGDLALQRTARTLVCGIRPYDMACRLGGDEFALIFPETGAEDAERIAVRMQQSLAAELSAEFSPLTFSYGVLMVFPPITVDPAQCLVDADRALYAAKRAGKNAIRCVTMNGTAAAAWSGQNSPR